MQNKKSKVSLRHLGYLLEATAVISIIAVSFPTTNIAAEDSLQGGVPIYNLSSDDPNLADTIKTNILVDRANRDQNLNLENIDFDRSKVEIESFDQNKAGMQPVKVKVTIAAVDDQSKNLSYTFSENAIINIKKSSAPTIKLKSDSITVNNGDTWNPSSYVASISDESGILPAMRISDNVNMNEDGDYYVSYTAIDNEGNKTNVVMNVTVKTPDEVVASREEDAKTAQAQKEKEELEKKKKAEQEKKEREEKEKAAQAEIEYTNANGEKVLGSGQNPYPGGWNNCTWGAWTAAYNATGIAMPNFGNATGWIGAAQKNGYATGGAPSVGSIAVYTHHVAYVDGVSEDGTAVHIVEGGYNGHYNERWVSASGTGTQALRGYIYLG